MSGSGLSDDGPDVATSRHGAMPRDLLLVRHGRSEGNVATESAKTGDHRFVEDPLFRERSTMHYRLVAEGREQAAAAGEWIRSWMAAEGVDRFDRYSCSPYVRTMETAALLDLPGAEWRRESLLRERDFGAWEGLGRDRISELFEHEAAYKTRNRYLYRPTGGESLGDVELRVREVLASLAREMEGRRVLCVAHEDVIWAFRYRLEKMTIREYLAEHDAGAEIPNGGVVHFTRVRPDGTLDDRFHRVRTVTPGADADPPWRTIERPTDTNEDLLAEVAEYECLWGGDA